MKLSKIFLFVTITLSLYELNAMNQNLFDAVAKNNIVEARELLDQGANINHRDKLGRTPLFEAKSPAIARLLLQNGAHVNIKERYQGRTALHVCRDPEVVKLLILYGAEVNVQDNYLDTPLHVCAKESLGQSKNDPAYQKAVTLMENGADYNATNIYGNGPIVGANGDLWNLLNSKNALIHDPAAIKLKSELRMFFEENAMKITFLGLFSLLATMYELQ